MDDRDRGLLIVNADDFGIERADTDAILSAFAAGAISSATAMVWMADSDRAARIARDLPLPLGLHLNLIEPYTASDVPPAVARTQRRVTDRIRRAGRRALLYHPEWASDFRTCIGDQIARFEELYGRLPTHFDGHRHMHLVPNCLLSEALRPLRRCRRSVTRTPQESARYKQAARDLLFLGVSARFATTRWCFSIRALRSELGGPSDHGAWDRARGASVEIMVHPGWEDERAVLLDRSWCEQLRTLPVGSFAELGPRGGRLTLR